MKHILEGSHIQIGEKWLFPPLPFLNKDIDAINIANILLHKNAKNLISKYFKYKSIPITSYFHN